MSLTTGSFSLMGLLRIRSKARTRSRQSIPKPPPTDAASRHLQLVIDHRGMLYELIFTRDSELVDLLVAVREHLKIPDDRQKYFVSPNGGLLKAPFDLARPLLSLEDKKIRLIGTTFGEAASLAQAERILEEERAQLTVADNLEDPFEFIRRIPGVNGDATFRGGKLWRVLSSVYDEANLELLVSTGYLAPYLDPEIDQTRRNQLAAGLRILYETKDISMFRSHAMNIGIPLTPINHQSMVTAGAPEERGPLPQTWNDYDGYRNPAAERRRWIHERGITLDEAIVRASDLEFPAETGVLGSMPRLRCEHRPEGHLSCEDCRAALFLQWSLYVRKHLCYQVRKVVKGLLPFGLSLQHLKALQKRIARLDYEMLKGRGWCEQQSPVAEELRLMMDNLNLDGEEIAEMHIHGIDEDDVVALQAALEQLKLEKQVGVENNEDAAMPDEDEAMPDEDEAMPDGEKEWDWQEDPTGN